MDDQVPEPAHTEALKRRTKIDQLRAKVKTDRGKTIDERPAHDDVEDGEIVAAETRSGEPGVRKSSS